MAEITLPGEACSAGVARQFLRDALVRWNLNQFADVAQLLLTELVANAALHAKTVVTIRIVAESSMVRIEVADSSPRDVHVHHYSAESTTGRGLELVAALSSSWGVHKRAAGKTIWLELDESSLGSRPKRLFDGPRVSVGQEAAGPAATS